VGRNFRGWEKMLISVDGIKAVERHPEIGL